MADFPYQEDRRVGPTHHSATGTPRWVKVFGIIGIVVVVLFVILHLVGSGPRGH